MDDLTRQLMELGLLDGQEAALDRQLQSAQALGQTPVYQGRSRMAAALSALGNVGGAFASAAKTQGIEKQRAALGEKRRLARGAYSDALGRAGAAPLAPNVDDRLLSTDAAPMAPGAGVLAPGAAPLRGGDEAEYERLATMGQASGDPVAGRMGAGASDQLGQRRTLRRQAEMDARHADQTAYERGLDTKKLGLEREKMNQGRFADGASGIYDTRTGKVTTPRAPDTSKTDKAKREASEALRQEFMKNPEYKEYREVGSAFEKVQNSSATPAGDMSLVFGYMKLLDPGSTVREGEQAQVSNAGSIPNRIQSIYNKAREGVGLTPEMRQQFIHEASLLHAVHQKRLAPVADNFRRLATQQGVDPGDVVFGGLGLEAGKPSDPTASAAPSKPAVAPTPGATKVIKGVTYEKRADGGWYKAGG